jgi:imidazolonepropionase-like amidohydrolase
MRNDALMIIAAGWMLDGRGGLIRQGRVLEVSGGLIVSIRKIEPADLEKPELVNLSNSTLLPGLVDSHVHLCLSGEVDPHLRRRQLHVSFVEAEGTISAHLGAQMAHGVVALRDGGDFGGHALRYRRESIPSTGIPIHLSASGRAWHAPGRYGGLIGRPPSEGYTLAQSIMKREDGNDHVKIVNSGLNSLTTFGKETPPQFDPDELKEAVQAARALGLKTMVHANGYLPVSMAIRAGCDSIEHGYFMGRDNLKQMAEKKVTWVPTLFAMEAYSHLFSHGSLESETARRNLDRQLDQVRMAKEYGVIIAVGTDAGSPGVCHGQAVREEMRLLMLAGIPLESAVRCATSRGASLLGLQDEMGTLAPGMPATFVATKGGPERLPETLDSPEAIFIRGKAIKRVSNPFAGREKRR